VFYDEAVIRQVDVPSFSGSFGILPKHVPTLAVLKPGVVTIYEEEGTVKKIFVSSGTVTINEDNSVQVRNWDSSSKAIQYEILTRLFTDSRGGGPSD